MASDDQTITITRQFAAPPGRVWAAWTDPSQVARWWGPRGFTTRVEALDLRPGGRSSLVMVGPDGDEYPVGGRYLEVVPAERIVSTSEFGDGFDVPGVDLPRGLVMTAAFAPDGAGTRLTLTIAHPSAADKATHEAMGVVGGWQSSFDRLDDFLAPPAGPQKVVPCLWFDGQAEAAAGFYTSLLPDSRIDAVHRSPTDTHAGPAGSALMVEFTLAGRRYVGLNGGPGHPFTDAVSFQILCADQAEVDRLWAALTAGGREVACSWVKDRYGLSWQVVPTRLLELMAGPDRERAGRVMRAMMGMVKIDIAELERAATLS